MEEKKLDDAYVLIYMMFREFGTDIVIPNELLDGLYAINTISHENLVNIVTRVKKEINILE